MAMLKSVSFQSYLLTMLENRKPDFSSVSCGRDKIAESLRRLSNVMATGEQSLKFRALPV